jgi:excisionase family DNA binding protein
MNSETSAPRLLLSIDATARQLSVGRTSVYNLIAQREVEVVHIGRRSLVTESSISRYLERLKAASR